MNAGIAFFVCLLIFIALIFGGYYFVKYLSRKAKSAAINRGEGVLWFWLYEPEEWKYAAQTVFDIKTKRLMETGKVCFTKDHIYVSNGKDEILFELIGKDKYTTHLTEVFYYKSSAMNNIRFEVRSKEITTDGKGNDTFDEKYETKILIVPIPKKFEEEGEEVIEYYQNVLDKNPDAIAAVSPYGLGLFGR